MMRQQQPQGGRIVNNGSVSAHVPRRHSAPYASTKHALTGLTRSLSLDGRDYNIACGEIDIGNAATSRNEDTRSAACRPPAGSRPSPAWMSSTSGAVVYMATLSLDANVQFMSIMATKMPHIGGG